MRSKPIERPCFRKQSGRHLTNGTLSWLLAYILQQCTFAYVQTCCAYIFLCIHVHVHTHTHTLTQEKPKLRILFGEDHLPIMYKAWVPSQHYQKKGPYYYALGIQVPHFSLNYHSVEKLYLLTRKSICSVFSMLYYIKQTEIFFQIGTIHACNINI